MAAAQIQARRRKNRSYSSSSTDLQARLIDKVGLGYFLSNRVARSNARNRRVFQTYFADEAMHPTSIAVLSLIIDNPESSQSAIAASIGVDRSALVPIIDDLEEKGFVIRHRSGTDRRTYALIGTASGAQYREQALKKLEKLDQQNFAKLNRAEREKLRELLGKLLDD